MVLHKKINIPIVSTIVIIGFVSLFQYFSNHYSIDCYRDLYLNEQLYLSSIAGRPFAWILLEILSFLNISIVRNQQIFWLLAMLIYASGVFLLVKKFLSYLNLKRIREILLLTLIISALVFNIFTTEVFQFNTFNIVQAFAFLFVSLAINTIKEKATVKNSAIILIYLTLSLFFYQSWIAFFIIISGLIVIMFFEQKKLPIISILLVYVAALGINFAYILVIHPMLWPNIESVGRMEGLNLYNNIISILYYQKELWINSLNMLPRFVYALMSLASFAYVFLFKKALKHKQSRSLLLLLAIVFFSMLFGLVLHLFTANIWLSQRSTLVVGSIPFMLLLVIFLNFKGYSGKAFQVFTVLVSILLLVQIVFMNKIGNDMLKNNQLELNEAREIVKEIESYESMSGQIITDVFFINDINPAQSYPGITQSLDVNVRGLTRSWTFPNIMKFVGADDLNYHKMTVDDKLRLFGNIDKEVLAKDNFIFIDNKLYLMLW